MWADVVTGLVVGSVAGWAGRTMLYRAQEHSLDISTIRAQFEREMASTAAGNAVEPGTSQASDQGPFSGVKK